MKQILILLCLVMITTSLKAQYIHKIKGDTVLITNDSCSAELNIENSTKLIKGFLYNRGNGRTEFRRGMIKINDSLYLFGYDTLNLKAAISLVGSNSANIYNSNGTLTGNRFLDLGTSSFSIGKSGSTNFSIFNNGLSWFGHGTPSGSAANGLHNNHLFTATSGNAKGLYVNDSMIASANNDTLVALDINPGYNNSSFTGVSNIDLRTKNGNVVFGSGVGYGKYHGIANDGILQLKTEGANKTQLWFRPYGNPSGNNGNYWGKIEIETYKMSVLSPNYGALHVQNAGVSYGLYLGGWSSNYAMYIHSQTRSVNIGGFNTDDSTAILKVVSTTRGFLPPVWTQAQRLAIDGVSKGLIGYQGDNTENLYLYKSTGWKQVLTEDDRPVILSASQTLDFPNTFKGNSSDLTITVTGANPGDVVNLGVPPASVNDQTYFMAWVSATGIVTVRFSNLSSGWVDPSSAVFKVKVMQ